MIELPQHEQRQKRKAIFQKTTGHDFRFVTLLIILSFLFSILPDSAAFAQGQKMTQYRLYERDRIVMEFAGRLDAIREAKKKPYRYVEEIPSRKWVYSNVPRYVLEQNGSVIGKWNAQERIQALRALKGKKSAALRDLEQPGWLEDTYPRWLVYSKNTRFKPEGFRTKAAADQAIRTLKKQKRAGWLIDLTKMTIHQAWLMPKPPQNGYRIESEVTGSLITDATTLLQGLQIALSVQNARVVDRGTGMVWFVHDTPYEVIDPQTGTREGSLGMLQAISKARQQTGTWIEWNGQTIWSQQPAYTVRPRGVADAEPYGLRWSLEQARAFAAQSADAEVLDDEGEPLWNARRALEVWAWNGSSAAEEVIKQVEQTVGLDVSLPTWFILKNANGELEDRSDPALVQWLHGRGIEVHPLLHNQFDPAMTSAFLQSEKAQTKWIDSVMTAAKRLRVDGLNLDFESIRGSDRERFTKFAVRFAERAKRAGFRTSIDLPRSDIRWDHKTAFDRPMLAKAYEHICIMAYDEHYRGGNDAGSVASLPWAQGGIELFLNSGVQRDQLILGVPFYTRVWQTDKDGNVLRDKNGKLINRTMWATELETVRRERNPVETFDPEAGLLRINYEQDGLYYVVWQEDRVSLKQRFEMAKQYDLGGVAAWRLGYEPAALWPELVTWK